jgi:large subunit ribosomal protein L18
MAVTERKSSSERRAKALSVRRNLRARTSRPRLSVFRSLAHIYAQVIDDLAGRTLAAASSQDKALRDGLKGLKKVEVASRIGAAIAERAKAAGVVEVAFDRGCYKFHGRVRALAEAARQAGLRF